MSILVVGNIIKDVYLNLDDRTAKFETDKNNTKWLDLSFDASEHRFFNRVENYGGAAVSLEVLQKLGLKTKISGSNLNFADLDKANDIPEFVSEHRYILVNDENVTYFAPSTFQATPFTPPKKDVDYIYIDRSANLDKKTADKIVKLLQHSENTGLILYIRDFSNKNLNSLLTYASLIFLEKPEKQQGRPAILDALPSPSPSLPEEKLITLSETSLSYMDITEPLSLDRVNMMTHLSTFSIASATILGCFVLGFSVENSLKFAKLNLEHSKLNASLSLKQLKELKNTTMNASNDSNPELIAKSLVMKPKGILAADESGGSIEKKFAEAGIENTYENRRFYRNLFFSTDNLEDFVNGVILFDETARSTADNGENVVKFLTSKGIIPGIKVDGGLEKFENSEETYTKGLDGLDERLKEYYNMGLRFAKWRAAFNVNISPAGDLLTPSDFAIHENAEILAEYAKKCQNAGIVPIVEPEVVHDGYYSVEACAFITAKIFDELFKCLKEKNVDLKGCLLKTNMVLAGKKFERQSTPEEVGIETAKVLKEHVPADLAGVVFLSGGQTVQQATDNLAEVTKNGPYPWPVTFSYARALQGPALDAWAGHNENASEARAAFRARLVANTDALKVR